MSNELLAISWDDNGACGVVAQVQKGRVSRQGEFRLAWSEGGGPAESTAVAGDALKRALHDAGIKASRAAVLLPREYCTGRRLNLPDMPDDELPDIVNLQAATVSSAPLDRLLIDFVPMPRDANPSGRTVLLATTSRERVEQMRKVLEAAGLELASLGLSVAAIGELVAHAEAQREDPAQEPSLVLSWLDHRLEVIVMRQRHVLFAHSTECHEETPEETIRSICGEISRTLITVENLLAGQRVTRCWAIGCPRDHAALFSAIAARFKCDVRALDDISGGPLDRAQQLSGANSVFAGPIGRLIAEAEPLIPSLDFINPRRAPVKRDHSRYRKAAIAVVLLLIAAVGFGQLKLMEWDLDDQIAKKRQQETEIKDLLKRGEPTEEAAKLVDAWIGRAIDPLAQIQKLEGLFPEPKEIVLTELQVDPGTRTSLARIHAIGLARDRRQVETLEQRLVDAGYQVQPRELKAIPDRDYQYRLDLNIEVIPPTTTKTATPKVAITP